MLLAFACGPVLGTVGAIWSCHVPFGVVIGAAMTCSMLIAGVMGTVIPMLSKRLGVDPTTTVGPSRRPSRTWSASRSSSGSPPCCCASRTDSSHRDAPRAPVRQLDHNGGSAIIGGWAATGESAIYRWWPR